MAGRKPGFSVTRNLAESILAVRRWPPAVPLESFAKTLDLRRFLRPQEFRRFQIHAWKNARALFDTQDATSADANHSLGTGQFGFT
jgi:hypothetical protein